MEAVYSDLGERQRGRDSERERLKERGSDEKRDAEDFLDVTVNYTSITNSELELYYDEVYILYIERGSE